MDSAKDLDIKNLLILWRCEILYNLFREEDIDVEELKIIKYHHVHHLLQPYKMGIRIRFEHYLGKWRNHIGIPLNAEEFKYFANGDKNSSNFQHQSNNGPINDHYQIQNESPAPTTDMFITSIEENLSNKDVFDTSPQERPEYDCPKTDPISPKTPITVRSNTLRSSNKRSMINPSSDVSLSDYIANAMDTDTTYMRGHDPFILPQILHKSGSKGLALIKRYNDNKEFTNVERIQLIQIICDFFKEHEYHLSLNISHDIEREILQMFPTEKLHNYRTEKRGKIYVKYSNMKSYKRERLKTAEGRIQRDSIGSGGGEQKMNEVGNIEMNVISTSCDSWPERPDPEISIKTEDMD